MPAKLGVRILGRPTIQVGDRALEPEPPKFRQVLALLALNANETVSIDNLVDELWPECPPRTAVTTAQTYIYGLRQIINGLADDNFGKIAIRTRRPGYVLAVDRSEVDAHCFRALMGRARVTLDKDSTMAVSLMREALEMTPFSPLSDMPLGPILTSYADELREDVLSARQTLLSIEMGLRDPSELVGELRALTAAHPLRESFAELLMRALNRANRRAEALEVFRSVRQRLNEELGIEPGGNLQLVHQEVLGRPTMSTGI